MKLACKVKAHTREISLKGNERHLHLKKTPRISLGCKLVPVLYREYEYGVFEKTNNFNFKFPKFFVTGQYNTWFSFRIL